jgi:hypothetical protein
MKTHWKVERVGARQWTLNGKHYFEDGTTTEWEKVSTYPTRKAAVTVGMLLRDRGEPIAWPGGSIRLGLALVDSCELEA